MTAKTTGCRVWRGALAGRALGRADPAVDLALDAHLDGCPACRTELDELRATVAAVALADPERVGRAAAPPALANRIMEQIALESAATRHRRRRRLGLAVAGIAAAVAVVLGLVLAGDAPRREPPIELSGETGVDGSAALTERAWGTQVTLEVSGLDEGETYWLWLSDAGGHRVAAGSLTGTGGMARAVLASALPADDARRIWMTDGDDRVVLAAEID